MTTARRIERLWNAKDYVRLLGELLAGRAEDFTRVRTDTDARLATAALAVVRLDEFNQSYTPFFAALIRVLLAAQQADGGWGCPMTTALCVRALATGRGHGVAIERGLDALANLQKVDGSFPAEPLRRMPADAFVTAFVLYEVGELAIDGTLDIPHALAWLALREPSLDVDARLLWSRLSVKFRHATTLASAGEQTMAWS
jgi:hypothetical protein